MSKSKTIKKATSSKKQVTKKVAQKKISEKKASNHVSKKNTKSVKKQKKGDEDEKVGTRYFKCIMIDANGEAICGGRYCGKKPKQAGSKAYTRIYKSFIKRDEDVPEVVVFGMHECTRSSKRKKKYFYYGSRVELTNPEEVPIHLKNEKGEYILDKKGNKKPKLNDDNEPMVIRYRFNNVVKKLADPVEHEEYDLLLNYDAKEDEQEGGDVKKTSKKSSKKSSKKTSKNASKKTGKKIKNATKKTSKKDTNETGIGVKMNTSKEPTVKKASNVTVKKNTAKTLKGGSVSKKTKKSDKKSKN
jgi:hypothetical protein